MHGPLLMENQHQMTLSEMRPGLICCNRKGIEMTEQPRLSKEENYRERQATVFAITLALPRKSLEISVLELFRRYGIKGRQMIVDADSGAEELSKHAIPENLRSIYNMSKEAIRYRLMEAGFYITKKEYEEEHAQMSLFDI